MPKLDKDGNEVVEETPTTPQPDAFGVTLNDDGKEVPQSKTVEEEGGDKKPEDKKPDDKGGDDISNSPVVVELQTKIKEYGENLSGMRQSYEGKITDLEKQLVDALSGKKPEGDKAGGGENVLFSEIKFSKDLSQDERDDMTDTEIKLFDANATQQVAMNKMFETITSNTKQTEEAKVEDLNSSANVEATALAVEAIKANPELATDAKALVDLIIVEFNEFNNVGITPEVLKVRMAKALNNVNGYTAPKEQEKKGGGGGSAVKTGGGSSDTSKVDAVVDGLDKDNDGSYSL